MPSSRQVRATRTAISPRLAIRSLLEHRGRPPGRAAGRARAAAARTPPTRRRPTSTSAHHARPASATIGFISFIASTIPALTGLDHVADLDERSAPGRGRPVEGADQGERTASTPSGTSGPGRLLGRPVGRRRRRAGGRPASLRRPVPGAHSTLDRAVAAARLSRRSRPGDGAGRASSTDVLRRCRRPVAHARARPGAPIAAFWATSSVAWSAHRSARAASVRTASPSVPPMRGEPLEAGVHQAGRRSTAGQVVELAEQGRRRTRRAAAAGSACAPPGRLRAPRRPRRPSRAGRAAVEPQRRGAAGAAAASPQDRGAALGADHRVDRRSRSIEHPVGDGQRQRAAAAALAGDHRDHRHPQPAARRMFSAIADAWPRSSASPPGIGARACRPA